MRRVASLALTLSFLMSTAVRAQGTLVVSQNKCALDKQAQIHRLVDSVFIPIAQELVTEGKLTGAGSAYHQWGDEWNVVMWYTATNLTAFQSAFADLFGRLTKRHPTFVPQVFSWCSEHKDNIYGQGKSTIPAPSTAPRE